MENFLNIMDIIADVSTLYIAGVLTYVVAFLISKQGR